MNILSSTVPVLLACLMAACEAPDPSTLISPEALQIECTKAGVTYYGTSIRSGTTFITAAHVVRTCESHGIRLKTSRGRQSLSPVYIDDELDLAVLNSFDNYQTALDCSQSSEFGRVLVAQGFPKGSRRPVYSSLVEIDKEVEFDEYKLPSSYTAAEGYVEEGMSGGPVWSEQNTIAGVILAKTNNNQFGFFLSSDTACQAISTLLEASTPE